MKIALIVPGFSADERDWCIPALRNLAATLTRTDEVVVFALRYPYRAARYDAFGARVIALGGAQRQGRASAGLWRRAFAALRAEHRRGHFDALHAFWATEAGALTALAGRRLRIPTIVSIAGGELVGLRDIGYGDQLAALQRLKVRLALRLASHVTGGSRSLLDLAAPHLRSRPPGSIHHIPLGVDTTLFRPGNAAPSIRHARLITAASLVPVKDQAMLLRAVARLRQQGHDATLTVAGEGPEEGRLRALAATLGIAAAVTFLGALPHDPLPDLYRQHDLFVLTSRHEAQGMAPLEAAACGLPVVGTAVGILPKLAPAAGIIVPPGDDAALAAAIAALLADPTRYAALRDAAQAAIAARYGLARCAERFRALYLGDANY